MFGTQIGLPDWAASLSLSTQLYAATAAMLWIEGATEVFIASGAAPVSVIEDHPADYDGKERDRANDRSGEPENGGIVVDKRQGRHHCKEEHYHEELLPQSLRVGLLECSLLLVGVPQVSPLRCPTARLIWVTAGILKSSQLISFVLYPLEHFLRNFFGNSPINQYEFPQRVRRERRGG